MKKNARETDTTVSHRQVGRSPSAPARKRKRTKHVSVILDEETIGILEGHLKQFQKAGNDTITKSAVIRWALRRSADVELEEGGK